MDGDNRLDYMNNHHFGKCFASSESELAARARRPDAGAGCASNYEWVVGLSSLADEAGDAPLVWHERTLLWEDVVNDDATDYANVADCHGMVVADIDGDGLQVQYCIHCPALSTVAAVCAAGLYAVQQLTHQPFTVLHPHTNRTCTAK